MSRPLPFRLPLLVLLPAAAFLGLSGCASLAPNPPAPRPPTLAAPPRPQGTDVLPRWRESFEMFTRVASEMEGEEPLVAYESADSSPPPYAEARLAPALALLDRFALHPGETLVLPAIHGPETPFPDHHPLRLVASLRTVQARRALAGGDLPQALALVRQNLAQARATLTAEEGLLPLIHAMGVWQCALDGVHALAISPALPAPEARTLLEEIQADERLVGIALDRALRGEYLHVYRVIIDRMPETDDPDLLLSSVASLGMAEPEALEPGEIGLGRTEHRLLDRDATLFAYEADLAPYLAAFSGTPRFPRRLYEQTTTTTLGAYRQELGAFYDYAGGEVPTTLELVIRARAAMEGTRNPVGKLLAIYVTPYWETFIASAFRREAQRAAVCGLLAWSIHGRPAAWDELVAAGILSAPPADPFSDGPLRFELGPAPRVWSVYQDGEDNGGRSVEGNVGQPDDLVWTR